jgi:TonB-linked SusC/RagA family outer membrane protein
MNVKLKVLTAGALFFLGGQAVMAQQKKDSVKEKQIDEVVMVGYSAVKKEEFTGSVSKVGNENISKKNVSNVIQALTGEAAGVRVITTSGQPGSEPTIRIRGFGSANGNRAPLYVLDGVPFAGNISAINPDDIESMNILKDATATAIYGARGANGVVLINTKKGRSGRDNITVESKIGFNTPLIPRYDVIRSPEEYIELGWSSFKNYADLMRTQNPTGWASRAATWGFNPNISSEDYANRYLFSSRGINPLYNIWNVPAGSSLINPATGKLNDGITRKYTPEDWRDYAFQTSIRTENNLNISGGTGKTTYYSGIGYLKDEGYSLNTGFERYSGRLNVSHQAKPWLKGEFNLGYAYTKTKFNGQSEDSGSVFWFVDNIPSIYGLFLRDENGNIVKDPYFGNNEFDYGDAYSRRFGLSTNAIGDATYSSMKRDKHEINANFFLKADITKRLSFETRLGGQYYNNSRNDFSSPYFGSSASQGGSLYKTRGEDFAWNFLQMLRYMNRFDKHNVQAFVAHETTQDTYNYLAVSKFGLIIPDGTEFNNAISQNPAYSYKLDYSLESYFGQLMYDYDNKYLLSASLRRDGSSRFLNDKWDNFYSIGLGWVVTKENFLNDSSFFNKLKLKTSYGTVGDQAGVGYYPGYPIYDAGNFMGLPAASFNRMGYPNLTWEKSKIFQAGAEFTLFKNRVIEGGVDYYHRTTDNLIFDNRLAPSTGNAIMKVNDGMLVNQGVEFTLTGHVVNREDFFLDLSVNGEWFKNEITAMPIDFATQQPKVIDLAESGYGRTVGHSLYDFYMREWAGVNPDNGAGRWVVHYTDKNSNSKFDSGEQISSLYEYMKANPNATILEGTTEVYSEATQKFVGKSAVPDLRGAFSLNSGYKGFSLSMQFLYGIGGYAYDGAYAGVMRSNTVGSNNWHKDMLNRWQKPGDITDVPRLADAYGTDSQFTSMSTRFLTKSNYLALNNVRVAYTLPNRYSESFGMSNLTFSVSGDNLWLSTQRKGFNPTTSETGASSTYTYSPLSTITFGVKATF